MISEVDIKDWEKALESPEYRLGTLEDFVTNWSDARGILKNSSSHMQFLKAVEEMGELARGLAKNRPEEIQDAIGDVVVCLINVAAIEGTSLTECLNHAWREIKDRKGYLNENGVFVKEV